MSRLLDSTLPEWLTDAGPDALIEDGPSSDLRGMLQLAGAAAAATGQRGTSLGLSQLRRGPATA